MNDHIKKILSHWGLENNQVKQICHTIWQVGDEYILKEYRDIGMLERNLKVLRMLEGMNIPVGKVVPTKDNEPYLSENDVFYFLSKKLSGNHIMRIGNDMSIALMMGEIIADLHVA